MLAREKRINGEAMTISRREMIACAVSAVTLGSSMRLQAQSVWKPTQPIRIIVPFPAGGGGDLITRAVVAGMQQQFPQGIIVDNRSGASGSIGSEAVYRAAPDGHTLLMGSMDAQAMNPHINKVPFDATKFVPVAGMGLTVLALVGRQGLPAADLPELIKLANSGTLSYASAGIGSSFHVVTSVFQRAAKIETLLHVPYQGSAPALQGVLAGDVDFVFLPVALIRQHIGKLRVYGVTSEKRLITLPEVPALVEQGVQLRVNTWAGLLAPPGTPTHIVAVLAKAVADSTASPEAQRKLAEIDNWPFAPTPTEFTKFYMDEYRRWGEAIKAANIRIE